MMFAFRFVIGYAGAAMVCKAIDVAVASGGRTTEVHVWAIAGMSVLLFGTIAADAWVASNG
jgi:hypothetical protein